MKLGLFTPIFSGLDMDAMLAQVKRYPQIEMLELGRGCWPGSAHMDLDALRVDAGKRREYLARLAGQGLEISALRAMVTRFILRNRLPVEMMKSSERPLSLLPH